MRVHPLGPVVALDIDGHLGDYHSHFTQFYNNIYWPYSRPKYPDWSKAEGDFEIALGIDKTTYRTAKLAYRQGGLKRCMPQFKVDQDKGGVEQEIQYLRSQGIQIWICTSRPWMRLDNIDPDTQYWLENNVGRVDGVIYGEDKYSDLIDIVGKDRILGVSDDLPENIERANELGLNCAIRDGNHNRFYTHNRPEIYTFSRLKDLTRKIDEWKVDWDAKNPGVL